MNITCNYRLGVCNNTCYVKPFSTNLIKQNVMYEVTNSNFHEFTPKICESIKRAKFLSFDGEFSGINTNEELRVSLFDTIDERYEKLRNSIKKCIAIQFGLTTYDYDRDTNKYIAEAYNFYLFPKVVPGRDAVFEWRSSAVEFLSAHDFDFNKFAYQGISYLGEDEEIELRRKVANKTILRHVERSVSYMEEDELRASYSQVSDWLKNCSVGESMSLKADSPMLEYLMQKELRTRYLEIWTEPKNGKISLQRVDKELRKILQEREGDKLEEALVNSCIGFSQLFKLIVSLKIPIVGHNVLLDLMFMHQQFYKPLPKKYSQFKDTIHKLFPTIYDTKHISFELKNKLKREEVWKSNSLTGLYDYFKDGRGKHMSLNPPLIELREKETAETRKFHEAGWDSYCAGYCFLRMAHALAASSYGGSAELRPLTNKEILSGPKKYANCVNLIRGSINHMNFAGPDPVCKRPQWLHVKILGSDRMNVSEIAELFSTYGTVDVKLFTPRQALVAVANHGSARDILTRFRTSRDIHVAPYSLLRHSPAVKILLWGGVLISGGALAWMLHKNLQKTSQIS